MSLLPPAQPPAPAVVIQRQHAPWCREQHAAGETCLSGIVQIPDLPFALWAKQKAGDPNTIQIVIDGGPDTLIVEIPNPLEQ